MCTRKNAFVSEEQLKLDLDLEISKEVLLPEEEEFLTLLEEVLTEVFIPVEDEESYQYLEGRAIYDLADEKEIQLREKYDQESLDEGSASVEDVESLKRQSEAYFRNPKYFPLREEEVKANHCTGFIQLYSGEKFDLEGNIVPLWKAIGEKLIVRVSELYEPEHIIKRIEERGFKWSPVMRVVFYGSPLSELIGSRSYKEKESKELVPLCNQFKNILLAIPDDCQIEEEFDSTYEVVDSLVNESITFGVSPQVKRTTLGHWELTKARLEELEIEGAEEGNLIRFTSKERDYVSSRNQVIEKHKEASMIIEGLNTGKLNIDSLLSVKGELLNQVVYLIDHTDKKLNNPAAASQIRSMALMARTSEVLKGKEKALEVIQSVNKGHFLEIHLLSLFILEDIFSILWGNLGIKIIPEKKDIYFQLKERLLRLRSAKKKA